MGKLRHKFKAQIVWRYSMKSFNKHLEQKMQSESFAEKFNEEKLLAELAIEIARKRENKGISQSDLAKKAKITQQQVSKIENGFNSNIITLLKICAALELTLTAVEKRSKNEYSYLGS